jgi:hypothetical protein
MRRPAYLECGGVSDHDVTEARHLLPPVRFQHAPAGHQFGIALRKQRPLLRIAIAVREQRRVVRRVVLVGGTQRMQQFVRDDDLVGAGHRRVGKRIDHTDQSLAEAEGMRHCRRERRIVI